MTWLQHAGPQPQHPWFSGPSRDEAAAVDGHHAGAVGPTGLFDLVEGIPRQGQHQGAFFVLGDHWAHGPAGPGMTGDPGGRERGQLFEGDQRRRRERDLAGGGGVEGPLGREPGALGDLLHVGRSIVALQRGHQGEEEAGVEAAGLELGRDPPADGDQGFDVGDQPAGLESMGEGLAGSDASGDGVAGSPGAHAQPGLVAREQDAGFFEGLSDGGAGEAVGVEGGVVVVDAAAREHMGPSHESALAVALDQEHLEGTLIFGEDPSDDDGGGGKGGCGALVFAHHGNIGELQRPANPCCRRLMGWVLVVVEGADQGRRAALSAGSFRVIGRQEGVVTGTLAVARSAERQLEDEDHDKMAQHLTRRATPGLYGARGAVADFERDADIDLVDDAVSQTHAIVFCDDAGLSIVDVASKNGTWVNGDRVLESTLVDGDLVRVGETRLSLRNE